MQGKLILKLEMPFELFVSICCWWLCLIDAHVILKTSPDRQIWICLSKGDLYLYKKTKKKNRKKTPKTKQTHTNKRKSKKHYAVKIKQKKNNFLLLLFESKVLLYLPCVEYHHFCKNESLGRKRFVTFYRPCHTKLRFKSVFTAL